MFEAWFDVRVCLMVEDLFTAGHARTRAERPTPCDTGTPRLCHFSPPIIELQHAAQAFMTFDPPGRWDGNLRIEQLIAHALVIPFVVIVLNIFVDRMPQMRLANGNDSAQTLFLNGTDEAFTVCVQVGTLRWKSDRLHTSRFQ